MENKFLVTCDAQFYPTIRYFQTLDEAREERDELVKAHGAHDELAKICISQLLESTDCTKDH